eukprot:scaffold31695_cov118-Isochrysis_galbana.AAC.5
MRLKRLEERGGLEPGHYHQGGALGKSNAHQYDGDELVIRADADVALTIERALLDVGHQILVSEAHALGLAGRARRVRQRHDVFGRVDRPGVWHERLVCRWGMSERRRVLHESNVPHATAGHRRRTLNRRTVQFGGECHRGAAVGVLEAELSSCVCWVRGRHGPAERRGCQECDDVLEAVVHVNVEHVALSEAAAAQSMRRPTNAPGQLTVPDGLAGD